MYNTFILSFVDKINQLKLVILGLSASQQLKGVDWPICGQDDYVLTVEQTPKRRANSLSSLQKESTNQTTKMLGCSPQLLSQMSTHK